MTSITHTVDFQLHVISARSRETELTFGQTHAIAYSESYSVKF